LFRSVIIGVNLVFEIKQTLLSCQASQYNTLVYQYSFKCLLQKLIFLPTLKKVRDLKNLSWSAYNRLRIPVVKKYHFVAILKKLDFSDSTYGSFKNCDRKWLSWDPICLLSKRFNFFTKQKFFTKILIYFYEASARARCYKHFWTPSLGV